MSERVIVVGGGPSGSATAYFLARAGADVLLLDRARFPRDKPCSEYLSPQASRILELMGTLAEIENAGAAQLTGMRVHAPNGATIHGAFAGNHRFKGYRDRGLAVRRTVLDAILLERARSAGARVQECVRVVDLAVDRGRVTGVHTTSDNGIAREEKAALVVGADGLRTIVGRRLGLVRTGWPRRIALVTHYRGVERTRDVGEMHVEHGCYFGLAQVGPDLTNVALVVPVARAAELAVDRTEFLESWIAERPRLAAMFRKAERTEPVRATGPFASRARRAWRPGAALVGDAADFFDPFTGEGIYAALRGGELLADYAALAAREKSGARANAHLKAYDSARRAEFAGKWLVERMIGAAVAFNPVINRAASVLSRRRDMADLLVGVVGDFVPPREVLRPGYLLRLMLTPTR